MVDGAALLMAPIYAMKARGRWRNERGTNMLDGTAPWYDTYECSDGRWLSVGPIEPQFFAVMMEKLGLDAARWPNRMEPESWPGLKAELAAMFLTRTRDDWAAVFEGTDACIAPVLDMEEAPAHPHNAARGTFIARDGVVQPAPAPRFSGTPAGVGGPPPLRGEHNEAVLHDAGFSEAEIAALRDTKAI
jgi:alpha-methylacyl-CoA racemase